MDRCQCCGARWNLGDNQWISVKDNLPEKGKQVLIFSNEIIFHAWWDDESSDLGDWYDIQNTWIVEDVTHWMPLPKPPEG